MRRLPLRAVVKTGSGLAMVGVGILATFNVSPRPGSWLIRRAFHLNDMKITSALQKHTPEGVSSYLNERYRPDDPDALLDVYVPTDAVTRGDHLPTVVWTHGGAWVAGTKDEWAPYFQVLASKGYTVVGLRYSLGPDATYPTALHQINDAIAWLQTHADRLHVDPDRIVLAGDSAGAQISSQYAAMVTSPEYAREVGISPSLAPAHLRGMILYCGIYDFANYFTATGLIGWGTRVSIWGYTGNRGITGSDNPALNQMSTMDHVTEAFPPAFISGGNADPLTDKQSRPFANRLEQLGVDTTTLFFPEDHQPPLSHEYQFDLDGAAGQRALTESLRFLHRLFGD